MIVVTIATLMLMAGSIMIYYHKKRLREKEQVLALASDITQEESQALSAYEHYFDCSHPLPTQESLENKGLITWLSTDKFAITPMGYKVAKHLGVVTSNAYVVPVKQRPLKEKRTTSLGCPFV